MTPAVLQVVLVGGTGFLGRGLRQRLVDSGHRVTVIGRGPSATHDRWRHVQWDAATLGPWTDALGGADVVVHLAGKRVDCRPTRANIDALIASRVGTVRLVGR
ncbi:MAG: NAD(P)H-binding protein, partial [Actinomycetota bacterium]|nr:NAD(P)H-binding protein [Actinomycetota bacterium]